MSEQFHEKVSVNVNISTLSSIDLLVDEGYYSNRSDFINQALRDALQQHQSTIDRLIQKHEKQHTEGWFVGICGYSAKDIEAYHRDGQTTSIRGYGMLVIDKDCDEEKLFAVVQNISVKGKVICAETVRTHYGLR